MSIRRRLARFNRNFANRVVGPVLSRSPGFGAIHHRGRKSGRAYRTPVKLFRREGDFVISLPYGSSSDWTQNVLAAGSCILETRGRRIPVGNPRVLVDVQQAFIPAPIRAVLRRVNATEFLALTPSTAHREARQPTSTAVRTSG